MRVKATTIIRYEFAGELFVSGRVEVMWKSDGGQWLPMIYDSFAWPEWQWLLLALRYASLGGLCDFEHVDIEIPPDACVGLQAEKATAEPTAIGECQGGRHGMEP